MFVIVFSPLVDLLCEVNQTDAGMTALQDFCKIYCDLDSIVENMVASSRGMLEIVVIISRDLSVLALAGELGTSLDDLASAGAITISAFSSILSEVGFSSSKKIGIQLADKRYLFIESYSDYFLLCIAKPNARLGFIHLILEYYKPLLNEFLCSSKHELTERDNLNRIVISRR